MINGTEDPLVPYNGGSVGGKWTQRGYCTSTDSTIEKFVTLLTCSVAPEKTDMPDIDKSDGCTATRLVYHCPEGSSVQLIRISGGGHTWPGGKQYLGERIIGKVCRDFSAQAEVWLFFKRF